MALDSTFVQAWAQLARAQALLYSSGALTPAVAEATRPAAPPSEPWRSPPRAPRVTRPLARTTVTCWAISPARTPKTARRSPWLRTTPRCSELWGSTNSPRPLGRGARASGAGCPTGSPLGLSAENLGLLLLFTRHYPEAEHAYDRALQLVPANLAMRDETGDGGAGARRPVRRAGGAPGGSPRGGPHRARRLRSEQLGPVLGAGRGRSSGSFAAHAECVRR